MRFVTYLTTGAAAWSATCLFVGFRPSVLGFALTAAGSVLPEIDRYAGRYRGGAHSFSPVAFLAILSFHWHLLIPVAIGYGVHLAGDFFTDSGIPVFWGFDDRRLGYQLIRTGDQREGWISVAAIAAALAMLYIGTLPIVGLLRFMMH